MLCIYTQFKFLWYVNKTTALKIVSVRTLI